MEAKICSDVVIYTSFSSLSCLLSLGMCKDLSRGSLSSSTEGQRNTSPLRGPKCPMFTPAAEVCPSQILAWDTEALSGTMKARTCPPRMATDSSLGSLYALHPPHRHQSCTNSAHTGSLGPAVCRKSVSKGPPCPEEHLELHTRTTGSCYGRTRAGP